MNKKTLLLSTILFTAAIQPAFAEENETALLRQQIKLLEARLDKLERKEAERKAAEKTAAATAAASTPQPATASTSSTPVSITANNKPVTVEYGNGKGLTVTSADKDFQLRFGSYFQFDDHAFVGTNPRNSTDQFFIRSARPIIEAKLYDKFSGRLMLDFGNNQSTLLDAYGDYNSSNAFNIRVGKFKDPIGIERWQAEQHVLFVERGMTTNLVPYRDNGVGIYGNLIPKIVEYQLTLTNGSPDLVNGTNGTDNDQTVTGRLFTHPFANADTKSLEGIGIGVAGSYGRHNASVANPTLTTGYVTPAQSKFFTYSAASFADGEQWRINPQFTYYNGPFSIISEYVLESEGVKSGAKTADLENDAWEAIATYVLTGEDAKFDGVIPRNNFDLQNGHWGAFELVARLSHLKVDDATFSTFASLSTSAKAARETTLGGTWYLNPNIKFNLDFELTSFDGGAASGGDRPTEKAVLSRAQFRF